MAPRYPQPGAVLLGKYRVDSLIGEGGMGAVIKARHIDLDEMVAIKCLLPEMLERKDIVARFLREAKAAVKLKGEHVARVLDVGRLGNGVPYIVMEYLDGADLNAIIKHHGAQDPAVVVDLILQACEALAEAHSLGIIHRDIKASNFFITQPQNQAPILKVLDFGIATAPEGTSDLTSTQSVIGTPAYMAPEQMRSSRTADARSDIWSIGVVLYELLEGVRPFRSDAYSELCLKVGMDPPVAMEQPAVPDVLQAIVMKCLEKPVEKRYQTVAELAYDLMPFASDPVTARAAVEQCARLLGRRGSKIFDAPRAPGDRTPAPMQLDDDNDSSGSRAVPRLTPANEFSVPIAQSPISSSQPSLPAAPVSTLLGRPTPMPTSQPKTPTSINAGSGQVAAAALPEVRPRRRGLVIGMTVVSVLALGGAGTYYMMDRNTSGRATHAASTPTVLEPAPPAELKPEPVKAEPVKAEPTEVRTEAKPDPEPVVPEPVKPGLKPEPKPKQVVVNRQPPKPPIVVKAKDPPPKPPTPPAPKPKTEPGGELFIKRQ